MICGSDSYLFVYLFIINVNINYKWFHYVISSTRLDPQMTFDQVFFFVVVQLTTEENVLDKSVI